ncbi:MAG: hypothetical protein K0Q47_31 [Sedimentibacter sp.]|jgi:hypothetical protein|nr:hypothetical protein [Sedimentibacter sp.]
MDNVLETIDYGEIPIEKSRTMFDDVIDGIDANDGTYTICQAAEGYIFAVKDKEELK